MTHTLINTIKTQFIIEKIFFSRAKSSLQHVREAHRLERGSYSSYKA